MDLGLAGKRAVVTGGSRGIGRAIALGLAAEGAHVAICARSEEALRATEAELRALGGKVFAEACDVGDGEALDGFLDRAREQLGGLDILVNNVSALGVGEDLAAWQTNIDLDLMASVRATQRVVPWMEEAGGGSILFMSSISGIEPSGTAPYAAMKAALISYSKSLAISLAPKKIRVNAIAPGSIEFEGGVWERVRANNPQRYQDTIARIPWGRMGTAEEVADVAVFLASERARWVTGACIAVDGAQHRSNL
jgi:3-oxoacyl-[acyl-carrier protein] reductase